MIAPILQISRREVRDNFTDWRIVLPILILTFVLPQLLLSAADFAINFVGDPQLVGRLVPFVMLLVGIIPASFSLIAALEAFVGERERNSLEALLAMPISDTELYLGKLISSLVPPLLSSLLAIGFFAGSLYFIEHELWAGSMDAMRLVLILVLIGCKATTMVTAAVIISSHTTSIRAANLLASFVLLPMASIVQLEALLVIAERWDILWIVAAFLATVTLILARTGMATFNREEILSREHEQLNLRAVLHTYRTFWREYRPAGTPPEAYSTMPFSAARFYRRDLPQLIRDYHIPILIGALAALAGALLGPALGGIMTRIGLTADVVLGRPMPDPSLAQSIGIGLANAVRVVAVALISALSFGMLAFMMPMITVGGASYVAAELSERGGSWTAMGLHSPLQFLLIYVLPHGIIEIPAAILAAAMGLRIGIALMAPPPGFTVGQNMLWSLAQFFKVWVYVLLPLFMIAGLLEFLLRPYLLEVFY